MGAAEFVDFFFFLCVSGRANMLSRTGLFVHTDTHVRVCVYVCVCVGVAVWCQRWGDGLWLLLRDGILMLLCL